MVDISHPSSGRFLSASDGETLLRIARDALEAHVRKADRRPPPLESLSPVLREPHGAFVTLRREEKLRGCIGVVDHTYPLALAVEHSTIRSATRDPRFRPVEEAELDRIAIEVSALAHGDTADSPFVRIQDVDGIVIGRDGLLIQSPEGKSGLLLPQVPTGRGWDVPEFLNAICLKAGLDENDWRRPDIRLFRFSAHVFAETL